MYSPKTEGTEIYCFLRVLLLLILFSAFAMAFVDPQDHFCKIVTCIDAWDLCYPVLFWVLALDWMIFSSLFVGQGLMGATVASFLIYIVTPTKSKVSCWTT